MRGVCCFSKTLKLMIAACLWLLLLMLLLLLYWVCA